MALSQRDIVITPNRGASTEPVINFTGADASSSATITLRVINSSTVGTLSFEGTSGQLFSVTDSMVGTIFSVNDVSGIPSIEVLDTGAVKLAQYNGQVTISTATSISGAKLTVQGGVYVNGTVTATNFVGAFTGSVIGAATQLNATANTDAFEYIVGVAGSGSAQNAVVSTTNPFGFNASTGIVLINSSTTADAGGVKLYVNDGANGWPATTGATQTYGALRLRGGDNAVLDFGVNNVNTWIQATDKVALNNNYNLHLNPNGGNVGVGINTTAPRSKFEVVSGTVNSNADVPGTAATFAGSQSSGQGSTVSIESNDAMAADTGGVLGFGGRYITGGTGYANWASIKGLKLDAVSGNYGGYLSFFTRPTAGNNTERLRITANGGFSFGATGTAYGSAGNLLQSNGDAAPTWVAPGGLTVSVASNAINIRTISQTANAAYYPTFVNSNNAANAYELLYTTATFVINPMTSNVGIGITAPGAKLHVYNSAAAGAAPSTPEIRIEHQDINAVGTGGSAGGLLSFYNIQQNNTGWAADSVWGKIDFWSSQPTSGVAELKASIWAASDGTVGGTTRNTYIAFATALLTSAPAERMRIDSAGNVGIGTASPNGVLTLGTTDPILSFSASDATYSLRRTGTSMILNSSGYSGIASTSGTTLETRNGYVALLTGAGSAAERLRVTSTGGFSFGATGTAYGTAGQVLQSNGNAVPSWVSASGLVPTAIKTGAYTAVASDLVRVNSAAGAFTVSLPASPADGDKVGIFDVTNSCATNAVLVGANTKTIEGDATGVSINVIGAYTVFLYNSATTNWKSQIIPLVPTNAVNVNTLGTTTSANYFPTFVSANNGSASPMALYTAAGFTINPNTGYVGLGSSTITPKARLHIASGATTISAGYIIASATFLEAPLSTPGQAFITFGNSVSGTYSYGAASINYATQSSVGGGYGDLSFGTRSVTTDTAPTERLRIVSTGDVGIGTGTPAGKLHVVGTILATSTITAMYSDRRLKTNIRKITGALDKVDKLSGVLFTQNELAETFGYDDYSQQVGVIAQEVQEVQPEAVKPAPFDMAPDGSSKSGDNYLTVQYEKLVPLLIEAIKELREEVNRLKGK